VKKRNCKVFLLMCCSLVILPRISYADESSGFYLNELVVTASRVATDSFKSNANMTVITREQIEKKHYSTLGEALLEVPGLNVQNRGTSGEAYHDNDVYINGSKNVVYLIDGMRVNMNGQASEKFSTAEIADLDSVERIEVMKGAASTLYGSDAEGGVINIITRKTGSKVKNKVYYERGNFSKERYGFNSNGTKDSYNWLLSYQKRKSGNFQDGQGRLIPEDVDAKIFNLKFGKVFDSKNEVSLYFNKYESDYMKISQAKNKDNLSLTPKYGTKDNTKLGMIFNHKFDDKTQNTLTFMQNKNNIKNDYLSTTTSKSIYDLESININDQVNHRFDNHHLLIGGFEYTKDKINAMLSSGENFTGISFTNKALYLQDKWSFSDKFNLTSGVRFDDHSAYGKQTNKSFTFGYDISDMTNYYIGYKEFFVAPTVVQLYSEKYGNSDLKAEKGYTIEMGAKHYFSKDFLMDFNVFKRLTNDAIGLVKDVGSTQSHYTNYDEEKSKGFSLTLNKKFNRNFNTTAGYTYIYIDPQDGKNPNKNGYIPRGAWNIGLGYDNDEVSVNIDGRGIINRDGRLADTGDVGKTFWVWNLTTDYRIAKNIKLFANVYNMFNAYYTERVYSLDPEIWVASPGRSYLFGIEYTF